MLRHGARDQIFRALSPFSGEKPGTRLLSIITKTYLVAFLGHTDVNEKT